MRSLLPSTQGNIVLVGILAAAELLFAYMTGFNLIPFLGCTALFGVGIAVVLRLEKQNPRLAGRTANLLCVLLLLKVCLLVVAATGGVQSKFTGILYVPVFLAALFYYIPGSLGVGTCVSFFLLFLAFGKRSPSDPAAGETALTLAGVFMFVSLIAGIFSHGLTYSARRATRQANTQQRRAAEFEWFMDTSLMMESLRELQAMLAAGLMRLQELLPCDMAVIYLREAEGLQMQMEEFVSRNGTKPARATLTLEDQEPLRPSDFDATVAFWPDTRIAGKQMGAFRQIDPEAGSLMAVSLRTMDDMFGAVVVSARQPQTFTERHRDLFLQFARHVVYPILRIRLHALATTDTLTGLSNNRAFRRRLQDEVERAQRYRHPLSLIMLDLDHFKRVNDTEGHPAGDAILSQVGNLLRRGSRATDLVARYGGEEMVVLCPETRPEEARIVAERIRESIANLPFHLPTGGKLNLTISLGIAALPEHGTDAESLINAADQALYEAKSRGRNRVCVAAPPRSPAPVGSR